MNSWAIPLIVITIIILSVLLFINQSQNKSKNTPTLSPVTDNSFQPMSLTPTQNQPTITQQPQPTVDAKESIKASYSATIKTSKGDIIVNLRADAAPNTVKNFINKAKSGFYANLTFHRVEDWVIQGGDPEGNGTGGGEMQTELNQLPFTKGALGIARRNDIRISNDAQFFIVKTDADWLNGQYTNFGNVTSGMNVVNNMRVGDKILGITIEN